MTDETVFAAALALPDPAARAAYLDRACADNPALRREVEDLLAAHAASNPLDHPPRDVSRTGDYVPRADSSGPTAAAGDRVGPYKLLERIGEGGMGEVWVADQLEPIKRRVAVKLIKPGMDSRGVLARFEAERQALALMDHPNIAKVLDAGTTTDGRPYFVMELVKGTPITEFCDKRRLTPRERLELFVPVCQAIQHAHQKGIIHRDIKPGNVLVELHDDRLVPKVIDFGVAKAVGQQLTEKTIYTGFGALVGTPAYMAPEQATFNAVDVDTRADVYALGILLYELLAGTPPIERDRLHKAALEEVLRIVRDEEPPRPSQRLSTSQVRASIAATRQTDPAKLSALMRGELDWIVMKALEKDRTRRYDTPTALAKDVERYLTGDAVEACPPTLGYRLKKAYRRNRAAVLVIGGVALSLLFVTAALAYGVSEAGKKAELREALDRADVARADAEVARDLAAAERAATEQARETLARIEYARTIDLSYREFHANHIERAKELLDGCADRHRGWEWRYLARLLHPEDVCLTHQFVVRLAAFSPDGGRLVTGTGDGIARLCDPETGQVLRTFDAKESGMLNSVQFTPDGTGLLTAHYHSVRLWNLADGKELLKLPHNDTVFSAAISTDGSRIATCCQDRKARVWDAKTGKLLVTVDRYPKLYGPIRFDPTGETVLTIDGDQAVRLWDSRTGEERRTIPQRDYPRTARFSPNGTLVACAGSDKWVRVFEASTGKQAKPLKVDSEEIEDLAFSPDGARIATAGRERTVRIWDVGTARELETIRSHAGAVNAVVYSTDGKRLLTASEDRTARVWNVSRLPGSEITRPMIGLLSLTASPDGRFVAVGGREGEVQVWDLLSEDALKGSQVWTAQHATEFVRGIAFSPDGKRLATASEDGSVRVWSAATGERLVETGRLGSGFQCIVFHPTRDELACSALDGGVYVLEGRTCKTLRKLDHPADPVWAVAYTPDGRSLVTGGWDGRVRVWDTATWALARVLEGRPMARAVVFSADGGRMAVRHQGGHVAVWDFVTGRVTRSLSCPREDGICVAITPDGSRVATSGQGGEVHVWDVDSGAELLSPVFRELRLNLNKHPATVYPLAFTADGHKLVTGSWDQSFRVWDGVPLPGRPR